MSKKKIKLNNQYLIFLKKNWFLFFSIGCVLFILANWFSGNPVLAAAEEGIPFYHPSRTFTLYKSLWLELGFGFAAPFYLPRIILYGFAAFLQEIGLHTWFIQASIFFILLLTPLIAVPKLIQTLFPEKEKILGYVTALFYMFNLYSLSQVFERFIYPLMFLWSYLPLFLLLWILWIEKKRKRDLFFLILSSFLYADVFGLTSSFIVFATVAIAYVIYKIIFEKEKFKTLIYGIVGFFVWFFCQLWWIGPILLLRNDTFGAFLNAGNSLLSLKEVSQYFPTSQIVLLKQGYFFGEKSQWFGFYNQPKILALSMILFALAALGIVTSRKFKKWGYIFPLFVLGWFISKGYNPPLGESFFTFLFNTFPITQILRNPYEKFGIVWLLSYSFFFSFGLVWIAEKLKVAKEVYLVPLILVLLGYLTWPFWTGAVFSGDKIHVPHSYQEANTYLNSKDKHRLLQLPLLQEASIEYTWGYRGEEGSEFLFDRPSLSRSDFGIPTDEFYLHFPDYLSNKNFSNILVLGSISGVVVHKDTIQNKFNQQSIDDYEREINGWKNISKVKSFDQLDVYTLPKVNDWVYSVNKVIMVNSLKQGMDTMVEDSFNPQSTGVVIKDQNKKLPTFPKEIGNPQVSFKKISPTNYTVQVRHAKKTFILILSNTYNAFWEAQIGQEVQYDHFKINGFANAWLINKKGDYIVDITFHKNLL